MCPFRLLCCFSFLFFSFLLSYTRAIRVKLALPGCLVLLTFDYCLYGRNYNLISMKNLFSFLMTTLSIILIALALPLLAECPVTNCDTSCGTRGNGCQITQYENGVLCSTTICHGKRGAVE